MAILRVFIFTLLFISVLCDNPTVKITATDPPVDNVEGVIIQQKGKDVLLTCVVENKPSDAKVQWTVQDFRKKGSSPVQVATATRSYDAFKWAIDTPTTTVWRLRIQNVQVSSQGTYTCKVEVSTITAVSAMRELRVVQKPEIADILTSTDMNFDAGEPAKLECNATGFPEPIVTWTRLAGELLPNGGTALQSNILVIPKITHDHAGIYKCTSSNSAGFDERRILITVQFGPIVKASTRVVRQMPGYVIQLVCDIMGYPMPDSSLISWTRENQPVIADSRVQIRNIPGAYNRITSILDIRGVRESDIGLYTCVCDNLSGTSSSDSLELRRASEPQKDRSNRVVAGSSNMTVNIGLTIMMVLSVWLLQRIRIQ